jgi:hypothetical protein
LKAKVESNPAGHAMAPPEEMVVSQKTKDLQAQRRQMVSLMSDVIKLAACILEAEQAELLKRFPGLAECPGAPPADPAAIRAVLQSEFYRGAVEAYVEGRLGEDLFAHIVKILARTVPEEFGQENM